MLTEFQVNRPGRFQEAAEIELTDRIRLLIGCPLIVFFVCSGLSLISGFCLRFGIVAHLACRFVAQDGVSADKGMFSDSGTFQTKDSTAVPAADPVARPLAGASGASTWPAFPCGGRTESGQFFWPEKRMPDSLPSVRNTQSYPSRCREMDQDPGPLADHQTHPGSRHCVSETS